MIAEPNCNKRDCMHFIGVEQTDEEEATERCVCAAFPKGIPGEIAYGSNPHTTSFLGDHGIMYEQA
jgi:hypothetical protein